MLLENPGPIMATRRQDSRSYPDGMSYRQLLSHLRCFHPVARIEVSASVFKDQGWGQHQEPALSNTFRW